MESYPQGRAYRQVTGSISLRGPPEVTFATVKAPLLACALLVAGCHASDADAPPTAATPPVPVSARFVTDAQGRALLLRGSNVSGRAKSDPLRSPGLTDADVERMSRRYGFNLARYLVLWDALEPTAGAIDAAYLDRVAADVARLGAAGVYVVFDMHQDVYATKFCCDGAPPWAIRDDGLPFKLQQLWAANYLQPAVERAFDNFWDAAGKDADLQQHYAAAWKAIATRFAGDPHVVGYDVINEPSPGSDFDVVEALTRTSPEGGGKSRSFDETKLGPFYQRVIDAIREVDRDRWVFVEPRYGAPANGSPTYLPVLRDPREGAARVVLAPHLYSAMAEASGKYLPGDATVATWERERTAEAARQGGPLLLGEYWAFAWSAPGATPFVEGLLAMADRMMIGWAYWAWDAGDASGSSLWSPSGEDNPAVDTVVRPYARAIAGEPVSMVYDAATRTLDVVYERRDAVSGPTEVWIPAARVYPGGFDVTLDDPKGTWSTTFDAATGLARVEADAATTSHHLRVAPKP